MLNCNEKDGQHWLFRTSLVFSLLFKKCCYIVHSVICFLLVRIFWDYYSLIVSNLICGVSVGLGLERSESLVCNNSSRGGVRRGWYGPTPTTSRCKGPRASQPHINFYHQRASQNVRCPHTHDLQVAEKVKIVLQIYNFKFSCIYLILQESYQVMFFASMLSS